MKCAKCGNQASKYNRAGIPVCSLHLKAKISGMSSSGDMNRHKIEIDKERVEEALTSQEALKKEIGFILYCHCCC